MREGTDEELMAAYRGGDAAAFEALYRRHRGALFRFILRAVRQRPAAEELFQETWIRVIEARARYEPQARFTTWVYTIAHNLLVDHWRRKGLTLVDLEHAPAVQSADNPARQAEARQALSRLLQALDALPAAQREAFLLHEEAGLSVAQIAEVTASGEEATKSRLRYAIAKLKAAVQDD